MVRETCVSYTYSVWVMEDPVLRPYSNVVVVVFGQSSAQAISGSLFSFQIRHVWGM